MLFNQVGYTLPESPSGTPLIGYQNVAVGYSATEEAAGFPASNMGNPATSSVWKSTTINGQRIAIAVNGATVNYLAIAEHSLFSNNTGVALGWTNNVDFANGTLRTILHFDGTDASTLIADSSGLGERWEAVGDAQIDTAQSVFGGSSLLLDGVGDYVRGYGGQFAFATRDFTIDCWVRLNATGLNQVIFDNRLATASLAPEIIITSGNKLAYFTNNAQQITGTTNLTTGTWYHVALCRSGTSTRLFLNGVQEGSTYSDSNNYSLAATAALAQIGKATDSANALAGWIDEFRVVDGTAYFTGTFAPPTVAYSAGITRLFANNSTLLHFEGADASTVVTESGGESHTWTLAGSAQIDTAQFKFNTSSLLFTRSTNVDRLIGDGSSSFAFGTGDFTIEFFVRFASLPGVGNNFYLYHVMAADGATYNLLLYVTATNVLSIVTPAGTLITGSTAMTTGAWHHVAIARQAGTTRLYFNGGLEGSAADTTNYIISPSQPVIGNHVFVGGLGFDGWIDEFKILKGNARYIHTFVPPTTGFAIPGGGGSMRIDNNAPIIFRFSPLNPTYLILEVMSAALVGAGPQSIAVVYAGQILALERGVKVDAQHEVINYARKTDVVSGMSENGQFLGRVVLAEWLESSADFAWFTPTWYRANFEPFVASAVEKPFFWVWNPSEYPNETAYAWLSDDVRPETDPATRRMAATIKMRAVSA